MKTLVLFAMVMVALACKAQDDEKIGPVEMNNIVAFLASDDLEGRDSGSDGIERAASYIETYFKDLGITPYYETYRDTFKIDSLSAFNIIGVLEGHDPTLKNEIVMLGAHYDHVGFRAKPVEGDSIANGANDNASGTATVLGLARHFAKQKNNKRTLMFVLFAGEEFGLLGSKHLAERQKQENLNLYTMVNFEMTGVPFLDNRGYEVFLTGFDLSNMAERINALAGSDFVGRSDLAVQYQLFKRSDNYPFYQAFNVPCQTIASCDMTNYNYYHHVDDEADKLDYEHMARVVNKMIPFIESVCNSASQEIKMNHE